MKYEIDKLLNLTDDEIYILVSKELLSGETNMFPINNSELAKKGKLWLERSHKKLMKEICSDDEIKNLFRTKKSMKKIEFVSAFADLLGTFYLGISPVLLSVIIVSHSYYSLCGENNDE